VWLLSDEIYRRLYYSGPAAPSIYDVEDRPEHVILLDGVSKAFAMTGWRMGFAEGPVEIIRKASDLQSQTTSGAAAPSQYAATAALSRTTEREAAIAEFVRRLDRNRRLGYEVLNGVPAIEVGVPEGGIYLFAKVTTDKTSATIAEELLEVGVACLPGEPFGSPGYLRLNFAVDEDTLREGLDRVSRYFDGT
jgi:aspartate aminotransferase